MPRVAITYEQVAAAANSLFAQGVVDPGAKAVRDELAKRAGPGVPVGSPNTIQKHLMVWRAKDRPMEIQEAPQLPPQLAADISRALVAAASVAREKAEERLLQLQGELDELVAAGEASEAHVEALQQEAAARTSERDSMAGQLAQLQSELGELKAALAAAQQRNADVEAELHAAQAAAQAAEGRVGEIRQSSERQLAKLQGDVDQARASQVAAERAAVEADKRAVAAEAHLQSERAAKGALDAYVAELKDSLKRLESDAARAAAAEASAHALRDQVGQLSQTVEMLRSLVGPSGKGGPTDASVGASKARGS